MTQENLSEVKQELKRFEKRLNAAIERFKNDSYAKYGCKESGAVKRAAMDLKNELTKITNGKAN